MNKLATGLSELELDALTELVNLGVSKAALSLREMVREEVVLSVPNVAVLTQDEAIASLGKQASKRLVAVQQHFTGDINGRALLIFPETNSLELVRAVVGANLPLDEIAELEQEALAETGNILLNGCLGTIANNLQRTLVISLPEVLYGEGLDFFRSTAIEKSDSVIFVSINFAVRYRDIQGYIAMLLDIPSLMTLKELIGAFIERETGHAAPSSNAI